MNPAFKKFRLVEDDEFQQIAKQKAVRDYNPELMSQVLKQNSMKDVLNNPTLNAEMKLMIVRRLGHSLKPISETQKPKPVPKDVTIGFTHEGFKSELPLSQEPEIYEDAGEGEVEGENPEYEADFDAAIETHPEIAHIQTKDIQDIILELPSSIQDKAGQIAQILQRVPQLIQLSENNELIIENQLIPNSNALDMFKYLYNPGNRDDVPIGFVKFKRILAIAKVPISLIGNKNIKSDLTDAYQFGYGLHFHKPIAYAKRPLETNPKLSLNSKFSNLRQSKSSISKCAPRSKPKISLDSLKLYKF